MSEQKPDKPGSDKPKRKPKRRGAAAAAGARWENYLPLVSQLLRTPMPESRRDPEGLDAVLRAFRDMQPWGGSDVARRAKFEWLHVELCRLFAEELLASYNGTGRVRGVLLRFAASSVNDYVKPIRTICLRRPYVALYLRAFGRARGLGDRLACAWAANLFLRHFPEQFAKARRAGFIPVPREPGGRPRPLPEPTPVVTERNEMGEPDARGEVDPDAGERREGGESCAS